MASMRRTSAFRAVLCLVVCLSMTRLAFGASCSSSNSYPNHGSSTTALQSNFFNFGDCFSEWTVQHSASNREWTYYYIDCFGSCFGGSADSGNYYRWRIGGSTYAIRQRESWGPSVFLSPKNADWTVRAESANVDRMTVVYQNIQDPDDVVKGWKEENNAGPLVIGANQIVTATIYGEYVGEDMLYEYQKRFTFYAWSTATNCDNLMHIRRIHGVTQDKVVVGPFASADTYYMCVAFDGGLYWHYQTDVHARVEVVSATPSTSGMDMSPSSQTIHSLDAVQSVTLNAGINAYRGPGTYIGFSTDCANDFVYGKTLYLETKSNSELDTNILVPGVYDLCFSIQNGNAWQECGGNALTVLGADAYSITNLSPSLIPRSVAVTVSSSNVNNQGQIRFLALGETSDCSNYATTVTVASFTQISISGSTLTNAAGTYYMCYASKVGGTFVLQAATITTFSADVTSIVAVRPSKIVSGTQPVVSFVGAVPSAWTQVWFSPSGVCNNPEAQTNLVSSATATLSAVVPDGSWSVCYSTGSSGVAQTGLTFEVVSAAQSFTMTPTLIGAGALELFTFTNLPLVDGGTDVRFSSGGVCADDFGRLDDIIDDSPQVATNAILPTDDVTYSACVSLDNGATWEPHPAVTLQVIVANPTDLVSVDPTYVVAGRNVVFTLTGIVETPGADFVLATGSASGDCDTALASGRTVPLDGLTPFPVPSGWTAGTYHFCYRTDVSQAWSVQSSTTLEVVVEATNSDLTITSPATVTDRNFLRQTPVSITATSAFNVPEGLVAFALPGTCGAGVFYGGTQTYTSGDADVFDFVNAPHIFPQKATQLVLCFSVDNGETWAEQTGQTVGVVNQHELIVSAIAPTIVLFNQTMSLTTVTGAVPTPETRIGLGNGTECDTIVSSVAYPTEATPGTPVNLPLITQTGTFAVCYSIDNGATYTPQRLVSLFVTSDDAATALDSYAPPVIPVGVDGSVVDLTITVKAGQSVQAGSVVAFAPAGECHLPGSREGETVIGMVMSGTFPLGAALTTAGPRVLCFSEDGTTNFVEQIKAGVNAEVVQATTTSITSVSPLVFGTNVIQSITLGGAQGSPYGTAFAFTQSTCSGVNRVGDTPITSGNQAAMTVGLSGFGTWSLCYSTDGTNFELQDETVTLIEAAINSISVISPTVIGVDSDALVTLTGAVASPTTKVAFSTTNNCLGGRFNEVDYLVDGPILVDDATMLAGEYYVCYVTGDPLSGWVTMTTPRLTVVDNTAKITNVQPDVIGAVTTPDMTFTGADLTLTTAVAFSFDNDCSTGRLGVTTLTDMLTKPLENPIPAATSMLVTYVCYTVNFGAMNEVWQVQAPTISVMVAEDDSISEIYPPFISINHLAVFTVLNGSAVTPTTRIAFVKGVACNGIRYGETVFDGLPMTLDVPITVADSFGICYSVTDGNSWAFQLTPGPQAVEALATSLSLIDPPILGEDTNPDITLQGAQATQSTVFAFGNVDCSIRFGETPIDGPAPYTLVGTVPADTYWVCYSTNGQDWFAQSQIGEVTVFGARSGSFQNISPSKIGYGWTEDITLTGNPPTGEARIGFALSGGCGSPVIDQAYTTSTFALPVGFPAAGTYHLCYSTDNGVRWVEQVNATVTLAEPSSTELTAYSPQAMGQGTTPVLTMAVADGLLTSTTYLAFSKDNCATIVRATHMTSFSQVISTKLTTSGLHQVCLSYSGNTSYVEQTAFQVDVINATSTTVTDIFPRIFSTGATPTITLVGAVATPTTRVAFSNPGECNIIRFGETAYPTAGPLTLENPLSIPTRFANLTVCYTVNNGVDNGWEAQDNVWIYVTDECDNLPDCSACHANSYCTWCLTTTTCGININGSDCAIPDQIQPAGSCPTLSGIVPETGDAVGGTQVTVSASRFAAVDNMICVWDFGGVSRETDLTIVDVTTGTCESPPREGDAPAATFSVWQDSIPYMDETSFFIYYDCSQLTDCTSCINGPAECGWCFADQTCGVNRLCNGTTWDDQQCSRITELIPQSINFRGEEEISVIGTNFINSTELICQFLPSSDDEGSDGGEPAAAINVTATWLAPDEVTCIAPEATPNANSLVRLAYRGSIYTVANTVTLLYLDDEEGEIAETNVLPLLLGISGLVLLLLICIVIGVCCFWRRKKRQTFLPPKLNDQTEHQIIFGSWRHYPNASEMMQHIEPLVQLLLLPRRQIAFAVCDVTQSTEADLISKSFATMLERHGDTVAFIKDLVTREVAVAHSESTLFRTNSFATKMFKTFSKMVGIHYVHEALGYELNYNLHKFADTDLDLRNSSGTEEDVLNRFNLLTICQKVFVAVVKSQDHVPLEFKEIFAHVRACMLEKFPINVGDLAHVVVEDINEYLDDTQASFLAGDDAFRQVQMLRNQVTTDMVHLSNFLPVMKHSLSTFDQNVSDLTKQIARMVSGFEDLESALDPSSDSARRLLMNHSNKQNSIAVGGFFFLRFLVPAITAPEAYRLLHDLPSVSQRKMLVLVGKVLQNLSNGKNFGGKEAYMGQLNDFIESNRTKMYALFDNLSSPPAAYEPSPFIVPQEYYETACCELYRHCERNCEKIIAYLNDRGDDPSLDAAERQTSKQMGFAFQQCMDSIRESIRNNPNLESVV